MPWSESNAKTVLITGGAGFIGSAVVRQYLRETQVRVVNVDKLTYAGNLESLGPGLDNPRHTFKHVDICNRPDMQKIFQEHQPDAIMHLAAESHVDRSIHGSDPFVRTNVLGTHVMLETSREYWAQLPEPKRSAFRFHHISTDEVYGDLGLDDPAFTEQMPYAPSSPYSASKAGSDHLVRSWHRTYGLPVVITNCSNNYGPYQFPEKLIPLMILNAIEEKPLPIYGRGDNVRDWLFVEDHARALRLVLSQGSPGRTYNIGGRCERTNLEVVQAICRILDDLQPMTADVDREEVPSSAAGHPLPARSYSSLISFVPDRPGHDQRYAIDDSRIQAELGWDPDESFDSGLEKTVRWYMDNPEWVHRVRSGEYREWIKTNYDRRE